MSKETTLHFFCGKMAAGKSTLAAKLADQHNAVLLCEDNWLSKLYPDEIKDIADYIKYSSRLQEILSEHIISLLSKNVSVVLDFPANTVKQRNWFRDIFEKAKVTHVLHFLDVSDSVCKQQLKLRSKNMPEGAAFTSEAEFDAMTAYFQPPLETEAFNIVKYQGEQVRL